MGFMDKMLIHIAPGLALKRKVAQRKIEIIDSGYGNYGASEIKKSMRGWIYHGGSAKEDIQENLDILRQRSRDLYAGAPIATGAAKTMRTNVVGTGLKLKSTIDEEFLRMTEDQARELETAIEREFSLWADSTDCDLERLDNFYELQQLVFLNELLSGDVIALLPTTKRAGSVYDLRIQLIEADRLCSPDSETINPLVTGGVEKNQCGEVVAYHIAKHHPLSFDYQNPMREWVRVEAYGGATGRRNIIHIMHRERVGQVRGIPFLSPVIESLKQLERYTEAELTAAVVSGLVTVFIQKENNSEELPIGEGIEEEYLVDTEDEKSIELAPGAVIDLGENEKANMTNPGRPNTNFDGFVMSVIKQIGCALEVPFEIVLKCFSNNYSASRGAILEFCKTVDMYRGWLAADFCQPVFEEFMCEAVAKGRIKAPGFFSDPLIRKAYCAAEWNGPSAGQLDPKKEVEAAELRVSGGFSTREKETRELTGGDFNKNMKQRKREEKSLKEVNEIGSGKQKPGNEWDGENNPAATDKGAANRDQGEEAKDGGTD